MRDFSKTIKIGNEQKWITIKPNGENGKGRHLPLKDGESPKEAMKRQWGIDLDKKKKEEKTQSRPLSKKDLQRIKENNPEFYQRIKDKETETDKKSDKFKKSEFELLEATPKAYKLKKDGKTFWIQKKWMREDGTLTPAGQNAFEQSMTDVEKAEAKAKWQKGVPVPTAKPDWESDNAYGYDVNLDFYDIEKDIRHRIFIPKSVIKDGYIPRWLIQKKIEEIEQKYSRSGGFFIDQHPFEKGAFGSKDLTWFDDDNDKMRDFSKTMRK
jgi:hypothetical protein